MSERGGGREESCLSGRSTLTVEGAGCGCNRLEGGINNGGGRARPRGGGGEAAGRGVTGGLGGGRRLTHQFTHQCHPDADLCARTQTHPYDNDPLNPSFEQVNASVDLVQLKISD